MKFGIVKTGGIRAVVRAPGLGQHLLHFREAPEHRPHLAAKLHSRFKGNTQGKVCPHVDGSFIQLRQEFGTQELE